MLPFPHCAKTNGLRSSIEVMIFFWNKNTVLSVRENIFEVHVVGFLQLRILFSARCFGSARASPPIYAPLWGMHSFFEAVCNHPVMVLYNVFSKSRAKSGILELKGQLHLIRYFYDTNKKTPTVDFLIKKKTSRAVPPEK